MNEKKEAQRSERKSKLVKWLKLLLILFLFLLGLKLMTVAFFNIGGDYTRELIVEYTKHPIVALFIGIFATAITQSSSLTTSIIVGLVATGFFPDIAVAVPIIMGANIGTSVTSTIVSLAHVGRNDEFHKAFSAGTLHDFFNFTAIIILLPLELTTGLISESAVFVYDTIFSSFSFSEGGESSSYSLSAFLKYIASAIYTLFWSSSLIALILSFVLLFVSLRNLSSTLKKLVMNGNNKENFQKKIFGRQYSSLFWGMGITALVQSSSITTSLTVPLVASNLLTLRKALPFLMGANIGTTFTALIASFSTPNEAAITIALCHLLYNVFAVSMFLLIPLLQSMIIGVSELLGNLVQMRRWYGFAYVLLFFFGLPILLIYLS
ncbi:MAG: Na/Pi symporter [Bacteroidota bacterium]